MPWVEFELTIPVFKRAKTFHALDREGTVIGNDTFNSSEYVVSKGRITCAQRIWKEVAVA
jgi:hypothetical protein